MLAGNHLRHLPHGGDDGIDLLEFFEAVAVLLQHLLQAAHLPLDAAQPLQDWLTLFLGSAEQQTPIGKLLIHGVVILP